MTQTLDSEFVPSHDCDSLNRMSLASLLYHALVDHPSFRLVSRHPGSTAPPALAGQAG
jgi:hypothetical protein